MLLERTHCIDHFVHVVIKSIEVLPTGVNCPNPVEVRSISELKDESMKMSFKDTTGSASTDSLKSDDLAPVVHDEITLIHVFQYVESKTSCAGKHDLGGPLRSQEKGSICAPRVGWAIFPTQVIHRAFKIWELSVIITKAAVEGNGTHRLRQSYRHPLVGAHSQMTLASSVKGFLSTYTSACGILVINRSSLVHDQPSTHSVSSACID